MVQQLQEGRMMEERVLVNAEVIVEDGVRKIKCNFCGYKWEPRKRVPKACPACKRTISATNDMLELRRQKVIASLPSVGDVRDEVPEFFTPECQQCGEEATGRYKGRFLCGECIAKELQSDGVIPA